MVQTSTGQDEEYTIEGLVAVLGPATEAEVFARVEGMDRERLVAEGADVATPRITKDCARDLNRAAAFLQERYSQPPDAMPGELDDMADDEVVMPVTLDDVRVAAWSVLRGKELHARREAGKGASATAQEARKAGADDLNTKGKARRIQMHQLFATIIAGDQALQTQLDGAMGKGGNEIQVAESLQRLVALGQVLLASPEPGIKIRRTGTALSERLLRSTESMATRLKKAGEAAQATQQVAPVEQGTVDLWDGINLVLYQRIIDGFAAARLSDPTIPSLTPIALYRYFNRKGRKPADEPQGEQPKG